MSRSTGTPKSLDQWLRSLAWREDSTVELHVINLDSTEVVTSWTREAVTTDPLAWSESAISVADADAEGRGQTTRYQLRHVLRDGKVSGATTLRRVVALEEQANDRFDGTASGLVGRLLQSNEKAYAQVLESSRLATESQQKSLNLLGQAYVHAQKLQAENDELRSRLGAMPQAPSSKPDIVDTMIREMAPSVGLAMVQKFMPELLSTEEPPTKDKPS